MGATRYQELSAAEMVELLDFFAHRASVATATGSLSNLQEALGDWALQFIQLEPARQEFDDAYAAFRQNEDTPSWQRLKTTAAAFAEQLKRLDGATKVKRCQAQTIFNEPCGGALFPSGGCHFTPRHR